MKKTTCLLAILISMAACTTKVQQPTQCELFGVHLGMTKDEVGQIIAERFGRPEEDMGDYQLEDIYSDGVKYDYAHFLFTSDGILYHIFAETQDIEIDYDVDKWNAMSAVYREIHRLDSSLALSHKIYSVPLPTSEDLSDDMVTIAAKDIHTTTDIITVNSKKRGYDYSLSVDLFPIEKNKYWNY